MKACNWRILTYLLGLALLAAGTLWADSGQMPRSVVSVAPGTPERLGPPHQGHPVKKWVVMLRN